MNEENEWDHKISAEVKEGPADCIKMAEVTAVLAQRPGSLGRRTALWQASAVRNVPAMIGTRR